MSRPTSRLPTPQALVVPECDCTEVVQRASERAELLCKEKIARLGGVEARDFPEGLDPRYQPSSIEALADQLRECDGLAERVIVGCDEYPCIMVLDQMGHTNLKDCGFDLNKLFFRIGLDGEAKEVVRYIMALAPEEQDGKERALLMSRFDARQSWLVGELESDTGSP
jgi:hypothetical protein